MKRFCRLATFIATIMLAAACAYQPVDDRPPRQVTMLSPQDSARSVRRSRAAESRVEYGLAAFISDNLEGNLTANGERYNRNKYTASHASLPFGTICKVINLKNGRSVEVRINDRMGKIRGRIIDLSYRAMADLNAINDGVIEVKVEIVQ